MKKRKVIFDCDNTMGMPNKDVDDGLTLIYLLGREDIELLGVTLTHGNGTLEEVCKATENLLRELKVDDLKVFSGDEGGRFLAEEAKKYRGEITVLATGAMTNLYSAYKCDNGFYENLKEVCIMGGVVEPLIINGKKVEELNLSADPEASYNVLSSNVKISVLNGHVTSNAIFGKKEINKLSNMKGELYRFIESSISSWVDNTKSKLNIEGFCNWDMAAAIFLSHKEIFTLDVVRINPDIKRLSKGNLNLDNNGPKEIIMPKKILDIEKFNAIIFEAFESFNKKYSNLYVDNK